MKKYFFVIIPVILILILIFLAFRHINTLSTHKGALQVTSVPQAQVYLNDQYIGRTPISKTDQQDLIPSGNYIIRLVPLDSGFAEYQEKINIATGILTVIDRKFRRGLLSEGYVISLSPLSDKNKAEIEVLSFPSDSKVELDANLIGKTPLLYKKPTESDHMLKINKNGYNEKVVKIRTPIGFRLSVIAYLSAASGKQTLLTPAPNTATSSANIQISTQSKVFNKVKILDTPTGFLRVRKSNNLNAPQISTVNPGESYTLINEQSGWFEIVLTSSTSGWISSQYARKE